MAANKSVSNYFWKFPVIYGILFSFVGIIVGTYITLISISDDYKHFYIYSTVAAFITAWAVSHFLIQRKNKFTVLRLISVSLIVGLFSHWLCWFLITLAHLTEITGNLIDTFLSISVLCFWSCILLGWATVSGSVIAIFLAKLIIAKHNKNTESIV